MVYGTNDGVYISDLRDTSREPTRVLALLDVLQVDVLEDYQLLIVLSGRQYCFQHGQSRSSSEVRQRGKLSPSLLTPWTPTILWLDSRGPNESLHIRRSSKLVSVLVESLFVLSSPVNCQVHLRPWSPLTKTSEGEVNLLSANFYRVAMIPSNCSEYATPYLISFSKLITSL